MRRVYSLILFFCLFPFFKCSNSTCPYQTPLVMKINANDSAAGRQQCVSDETCCFLRVQYSTVVGGFQGTSCLPVDYNKNTSTYNYSNWRELALSFCSDAKILAKNWSNIDYVSDCECGYKGNFASFMNYGMILILINVFIIVF